MKKKLLAFCVSVSALTLVAQTSQKRNISPFSSLKVEGVIKVQIVSYDSTSCEVVTAEGNENNVVIKQEGDQLSVSTEGNIKGDAVVKLGAKGLRMIQTDGVITVESDVIYKTEALEIKTDGVSNVKLMAEAQTITVNADGASNVRLKGNADSLDIKADGASNVKASGLTVKGASVVADGSSHVSVNATDNLKAYADGVSRIQYKGKPVGRKFTVSGLAKINSTDEVESKKGDKRSKDFSWSSFHFGRDAGFKHWMGVGINFNGYTSADYNTLLPTAESYMELNTGRSIGVDLNVLQHNFHIFKNYINLCTGLGFQFNTYHLRNKVTLDPDSSFVTATYSPDNSYSKNVLKATYINIPLMLEFNTSKRAKKAVHFGAGVMGGYKIGSRTKQRFVLDGYNHEIYRKDDYNLNPFKVQAIAEIGFSWLNIYGTYNLTTMFENGKGPELYPFTLGVRIIPFDWD